VFINQRGQIIDDGSMLHNGQGQGLGSGLLAAPGASRLDPGFWRPYLDGRSGRTCVELRTGRIEVKPDGSIVPETQVHYVSNLRARGIDNPVWNAATLRKDQWIQLEDRVIMAARQRLRAWADLMGSAPMGGFNGWARLTSEYQAMSDPGEALVDMDGLADGRTDRPLFNLQSIPLPITHSDFWFSDREIEVSANNGTPLNTSMAEAAGRRVAETVEQTLIGTVTGMQFGPTSSSDTRYTGTSAVYGYTNFPYRITKTDLTSPTGSNPEAVMTDVLEMVETMQQNGFFGPYLLYHSTGYSRYLSDDYFRSGSTSAVRSVRQRVMEIEGISDIRRLDYLSSGYQMILLQIDPMYMQALNGMDLTPVMWSSQGGMRHNWKIMCIWVPLLKSAYNGVAPILHATTS
jgi:hypothetical protein